MGGLVSEQLEEPGVRGDTNQFRCLDGRVGGWVGVHAGSTGRSERSRASRGHDCWWDLCVKRTHEPEPEPEPDPEQGRETGRFYS